MTKEKKWIILLLLIIVALAGERYLNKDVIFKTEEGTVTVTEDTLMVETEVVPEEVKVEPVVSE
jgi:hypothetical protein